ncbi:hypothetical protein JW998_16855 [candidate division KSB1 bacterium]|nr:hypothetical protein [candidate division KSB1 bacterium]
MARSIALVGGKAHHLARLSRHGFPVPPFFVISTRACARPLTDKGFKKKLARQVSRYFPQLATSRVAARSSAPLEDQQNHSFAGLYRSFLNLAHIDAIYSALQEIQQSLSRDAARLYSGEFSAANKSMAVILQKMIRPVVSGVIFTSHPVENDDDTLLLEIVAGECAALVSGEKSPAQLIIQKRDYSWRRRFAATEEIIASFVEGGDNIAQLTQLAVNVEEFFGAPQDIEWAFDGVTFWILQSRPITTLSHVKSAIFIDHHGVKWSNYFFAERFITRVSPLGWSFLQPIIRKTALQAPLWYLGYDNLCRAVRLKLVNGIPHAQFEAYAKLYAHLPRSLISTDKKHMLELSSERIKLPLNGYFAILFRLLLEDMSWFPQYNLWQWHHFQRQAAVWTKRMLPLDQRSAAECHQAFLETRRLSARFLSIHRWSITFADIFTALLQKFVRALGMTDKNALENLLRASANATMAANKSLLALNTRDSSSVKQFCLEYGHRSESLDIACPTWGEDIQRLKEMSAMLKRGRQRFLENQALNERLTRSTRAEIVTMLDKHSWLARNMLYNIFKVLLYYAEQFSLLRENQRDVWQRILRVSRFAALRVSQLLVAEGKLAHAEDIFYLTVAELRCLVHGRHGGDFTQLIQQRRQRRLDVAPAHATRATSTTGAAYHGIGVSQGRATGHARVVRNYAEAMRGQSGEILIAPSADPAWSPIFGVIAGLVMERGGVLSHASILAREFRLPTVTNIAQATQKIQDGDLVEIDGTDGRLVVLENGEKGCETHY